MVLPNNLMAAANHQNTKTGFISQAISYGRKPSSTLCPVMIKVDSSQEMTAGKKNGNLIAAPTTAINAITPISRVSGLRETADIDNFAVIDLNRPSLIGLHSKAYGE
jgi:hypothetical protein